MAKQSENIVKISGLVAEITHRELTLDSGPALAGTITIKNGPDTLIPVDFFAGKTKPDGSENKIYTGIDTMINEFKTIGAHGEENADFVALSLASLTENAYPNDRFEIIRDFKIRAPFFNRKPAHKENVPENQFIVSGIILDMVDEVKGEEPTGHLIVKLLLIGYNNRGEVIDFKIENKQAVEYVKTAMSTGDEVKFEGRVVIEDEVQVIREEVAFGKPIEQTSTRTERKLLVTSGTPSQSASISQEEIQTILAERQSRIEKTIEKAKNKNKKAANTSNSGANFTL